MEKEYNPPIWYQYRMWEINPNIDLNKTNIPESLIDGALEMYSHNKSIQSYIKMFKKIPVVESFGPRPEDYGPDQNKIIDEHVKEGKEIPGPIPGVLY
jgi:hypothetical protein